MQTVNYSNNDKELAHSCTSSQLTGDLSQIIMLVFMQSVKASHDSISKRMGLQLDSNYEGVFLQCLKVFLVGI